MEFMAEVLRDISVDPYFKLKFYFEDSNVCITRGFAEITRIGPKPIIRYDAATEERLKNTDVSKLELELLNTVISYMFARGVARTWKGDIVLNTA